MKTAYLFPGQGSQRAGMGYDLYRASAAARAVFDEADTVLGYALSEVLFGDDPRLSRTEFTQPALYTHSMAVLAAWGGAGPLADMTAGHSVGEYGALVAAGAIRREDGLRLVSVRGRLMSGVGRDRPGGMAAVLGMDYDHVRAICEKVSRPRSAVVAANVNTPSQIVVSGDTEALERLAVRAREEGARNVVPLNVSGAFHSPLMEGTRKVFAGALHDVEIAVPRCPVYMNVTGLPTADPDKIRHNLLRQITAPVLWAQTLLHLKADGAERFVEVGPGRVLSGLVRRTLGRRTPTATAGKAEEVLRLRTAA